jgi:hypothetical protein
VTQRCARGLTARPGLVLGVIVTLVLAVPGGRAQAQIEGAEPAEGAPSASAEPGVEDVAEDAEAAEHDWSLSASFYTYFLPTAEDYGQPTLAVDTTDWHVEARYNYEAQRSGSLWTGRTLSVGEEVSFDLTLMFGGVFGEVQGFAPGFLMTLGYWKLQLYSEGEYLFDTASRDDWYFYTWSELTLAPLDWLTLGFVVQRTRAYQTELDLQRGLLLGLSYEEFWFTAHVFDPALQPTVVLALGADW